MTLGDALTIGLVLLALWVFVVERYTTLRLEDGVRLGADAVRAAWRRVAPLVRWVAYDVIVGRPSVNHIADASNMVDNVTSSAPAPGTGAGTGTTSDAGTTAPHYLTDQEIAEALAALKTLDGKDRFSANAICELVGGRRNDVLAWVREVRTPAEPEPVQFPPQPGIEVPAYQPPPQPSTK